MTDPMVTITCWKGPLSALAARQRLAPHELMRRIRRSGGMRRGAAGWEVSVSSPTAMATLARVLNGEPTE